MCGADNVGQDPNNHIMRRAWCKFQMTSPRGEAACEKVSCGLGPCHMQVHWLRTLLRLGIDVDRVETYSWLDNGCAVCTVRSAKDVHSRSQELGNRGWAPIAEAIGDVPGVDLHTIAWSGFVEPELQQWEHMASAAQIRIHTVTPAVIVQHVR